MFNFAENIEKKNITMKLLYAMKAYEGADV
jgi:hypothetical protein